MIFVIIFSTDEPMYRDPYVQICCLKKIEKMAESGQAGASVSYFLGQEDLCSAEIYAACGSKKISWTVSANYYSKTSDGLMRAAPNKWEERPVIKSRRICEHAPRVVYDWREPYLYFALVQPKNVRRIVEFKQRNSKLHSRS